jgi:molecular chaperone GrpE
MTSDVPHRKGAPKGNGGSEARDEISPRQDGKQPTMQERLKRKFMTTKVIEEKNSSRPIGDEEIESRQNTDPATDPADDVVASTDPGASDPSAAGQVEDLGSVPAAEFLRLKTERDQLVDRLARLQAEFDNSRKREARERADFREYAVAGAVEQFLPVIDNFQLALKSTGSMEQLRTGVELIVKQMEEALKNLNVQVVPTVGTIFDPRVHEALDSVEQPSLPDQQVFEEVRRGYKIKERLLRPALVRVVSNPQQKEA